MGISEILAQIDREIAILEKAKAVLSGGDSATSHGSPSAGLLRRPKKRRLTPEGRKRIAEAVKRRWAEQKKKAAAGK